MRRYRCHLIIFFYVGWSAAKRLFFTTCDDKVCRVERRDALVSNRYIFIYRSLVYAAGFFSYAGVESRIFFFPYFLYPIRPGAHASNILFLRCFSRWLTHRRGCTCWISHIRSNCTRSFLLAFSFTLLYVLLPRCLHFACVAIQSRGWSIVFFRMSFRKNF